MMKSVSFNSLQSYNRSDNKQYAGDVCREDGDTYEDIRSSGYPKMQYHLKTAESVRMKHSSARYSPKSISSTDAVADRDALTQLSDCDNCMGAPPIFQQDFVTYPSCKPACVSIEEDVPFVSPTSISQTRVEMRTRIMALMKRSKLRDQMHKQKETEMEALLKAVTEDNQLLAEQVNRLQQENDALRNQNAAQYLGCPKCRALQKARPWTTAVPAQTPSIRSDKENLGLRRNMISAKHPKKLAGFPLSKEQAETILKETFSKCFGVPQSIHIYPEKKANTAKSRKRAPARIPYASNEENLQNSNNLMNKRSQPSDDQDEPESLSRRASPHAHTVPKQRSKCVFEYLDLVIKHQQAESLFGDSQHSSGRSFSRRHSIDTLETSCTKKISRGLPSAIYDSGRGWNASKFSSTCNEVLLSHRHGASIWYVSVK